MVVESALLHTLQYQILLSIRFCIKVGEVTMHNSIIANPGTAGEQYTPIYLYTEFLRMSPVAFNRTCVFGSQRTVSETTAMVAVINLKAWSSLQLHHKPRNLAHVSF